MKYVINLADVNSSDIELVGGKNASIGEMLQHLTAAGINVPNGIAITTKAYKKFLANNNLDNDINKLIKSLDVNNVNLLNKISAQIRKKIINASLFPELITEITQQLKSFGKTTFAVRSSATAEDLPDASFAGQQETFLNVETKDIPQAVKKVFASLFTSRAIAYRAHHKFATDKIAISVGIQPMIRSDKGVSGVMFTLDTESCFDQVILINASYGLGESIVQGAVSPDEFCVYKPALAENKFAILQRRLGEKASQIIYSRNGTKEISVPNKLRQRFCLNDEEIQTLANYGLLIEKHYGKPMDIEWAKDGLSGELYILQARPETIKQNKSSQFIEQYYVAKKGKIICEGLSIGQRIGQGKAQVIFNPSKINSLREGEVLVTDMTDPDWEPIMKKASAIVTNRGGRTCHAAIVARELGIPAIVGCGNATKKIKSGNMITVSCAEGETGYIYEGKVPYTLDKIPITDLPELSLKMCLNVGNPDIAFATQFLPNAGVGLARLEFIISSIGIHPNAAIHHKKLARNVQKQILQRSNAYKNPIEYYTENLRAGIAKIAAAFYPKEVIFRFSDFKSNEYANLLGGKFFEEPEENPMIGFRGASRYKDKRFSESFALECQAFLRVRNEMGLTNAAVMIPFVRTVNELKDVLTLMASHGLKREKNNLRVYMMCEIPSNVILAEEFLQHVDGFSIGSNDLTQLVLGLDRDSSIVASLFDERNQAVKNFLHQVITTCIKQGKYVGICGQGPSDYPDLAEWLMQEGIQSISLNPDSIVRTWMQLAKIAKTQEIINFAY